MHVDPVATHRDTLSSQKRPLPAALGEASVGADDAMPGKIFVDRREHAPDQTGRVAVDVAVGADEALGDGANSDDDPRGTGINTGRVLLRRPARTTCSVIQAAAETVLNRSRIVTTSRRSSHPCQMWGRTGAVVKSAGLGFGIPSDSRG